MFVLTCFRGKYISLFLNVHNGKSFKKTNLYLRHYKKVLVVHSSMEEQTGVNKAAFHIMFTFMTAHAGRSEQVGLVWSRKTSFKETDTGKSVGFFSSCSSELNLKNKKTQKIIKIKKLKLLCFCFTVTKLHLCGDRHRNVMLKVTSDASCFTVKPKPETDPQSTGVPSVTARRLHAAQSDQRFPRMPQ